ncbi:MAG: 3-dehydroquinate synthase [Muribaculaceae bacterium]|nr:3-dehydroquinate synthase [Muribaculaceae bacterium]
MAQQYLTHDPALTIDSTVEHLDADKMLVVTDKNVEKIVLPALSESNVVTSQPRIAIIPGEPGKTLDTVTQIWDRLEEIGATRRSLIVNIGGGVVTDIGGFAAACFKRGIRTVNFPTTLLGAVDAATGGKTGINFRGLKNEIGAFHMPSRVIISALPFSTLSKEETLSGYAEMVKTALISDQGFYESLLDMEAVLDSEEILGKAVEKCVCIKDSVVAQDPTEKGLRKILNFGHTAGHAFESLRIKKGQPVSHGKAVAHGMLVALILSELKLGFPHSEVTRYRDFLHKYYGQPLFSTEDIPFLMEKMSSDKKNRSHGKPVFTLLKSIGEPEIDCTPSTSEITTALTFSLKFHP